MVSIRNILFLDLV